MLKIRIADFIFGMLVGGGLVYVLFVVIPKNRKKIEKPL